MFKKCVNCGVDFLFNSKMPNKKYCSRKCVSLDKDFIKRRTEKIKAKYSQRTITENRCIWCNSFIDDRHIKYCSKKCKSEEVNFRLKTKTRLNTKTKGNNIKYELIKIKGGGCKICNYNNNIKALCFHHLKDKLFEMSTTNLIKFNKNTILNEANKCVILCLNCHQEIHDKNITIEPDKEIAIGEIPDEIFVKTKNKNIVISKIRKKTKVLNY